MDSINRLLEVTPAELIVWATACAIFIAVAIYVVGLIRANPEKSEQDPSEMLSSYREMRSRGEISEEEYREIKTVLASHLQEKLDLPSRHGSNGSDDHQGK